MFEFLMDINNYGSRKIGRDDFPEGFVSTCAVSDGRFPYETAICHKEWEDKIVVVMAYDTVEEAEKGHQLYVEKFKNKDFPNEIEEFPNSSIYEFAENINLDFKPSVKRCKPL